MHVLGEGLVLDIFRGGEFLAKNKTEKEIYRLCMQDEARHVSYGTMHLKYFLEHHPEREKAIAEMHALAEIAEMGIPGFLTNPYIIEPLAVLMGDGVKGIDKGMEAVRLVWVRMREEYLNRCALAGFDRRSLTRIPAEAPVLGVTERHRQARRRTMKFPSSNGSRHWRRRPRRTSIRSVGSGSATLP